jgi:hypothetical protein
MNPSRRKLTTQQLAISSLVEGRIGDLSRWVQSQYDRPQIPNVSSAKSRETSNNDSRGVSSSVTGMRVFSPSSNTVGRDVHDLREGDTLVPPAVTIGALSYAFLQYFLCRLQR